VLHVGAISDAVVIAQQSAVGMDNLDRHTEQAAGVSARASASFHADEISSHMSDTCDVAQMTQMTDGNERCVSTVSSGYACADRMSDMQQQMFQAGHEHLAYVVAVWPSDETVGHTEGTSHGGDRVSTDAC